MALDVIDCINDPRISHCRADVNGRTYRELFTLSLNLSSWVDSRKLTVRGRLSAGFAKGRLQSYHLLGTICYGGATENLHQLSVYRFMGGPICLLDGDIRSRCYSAWGCESFVPTLWGLGKR